MGLFEKLTAKAKSSRQRIVLPEGTEPRTLTAAARIIAEGIADIILIGKPEEIKAKAEELKLTNIENATIVDPTDEQVIDRYAPLFFELRKSKGISMEQARKTTADPLYLGCLMIKNGDADGQVAGALNTTGNVLRAAFQVIKTMPGINVVSGAFVMVQSSSIPRRLSFRHQRSAHLCRLRRDPRSHRCRARPDSRIIGPDSPRHRRNGSPRSNPQLLYQG